MYVVFLWKSIDVTFKIYRCALKNIGFHDSFLLMYKQKALVLLCVPSMYVNKHFLFFHLYKEHKTFGVYSYLSFSFPASLKSDASLRSNPNQQCPALLHLWFAWPRASISKRGAILRPSASLAEVTSKLLMASA